MVQRLGRDARQKKLARRGQRRLRTIAGALMRELERRLPVAAREKKTKTFALYRRMLAQRSGDKNKLYSLHEPHVYCIAKGKAHKKYEFGTTASIAMTKTAGVIVAAVAHEQSIYDGHTLPEVLEQVEAVTDARPSHAIVDRGYRGRKHVGNTEILVPGRPPDGQSKALNARMRKRFRRRAAIEPVIGHLKADFRLARCFLKGFKGDQINLMLAAAAWNLRKWMRNLLLFCLRLLSAPYPTPNLAPVR